MNKRLGVAVAGVGLIANLAGGCSSEEPSFETSAEVRAMGWGDDVQVVHYEWEHIRGETNPLRESESVINVEPYTHRECRVVDDGFFGGSDDWDCSFSTNCWGMDSETESCVKVPETRWEYDLRHTILDRYCEAPIVMHEFRPESDPDRDDECADNLRNGQRAIETRRFLVRLIGEYDADSDDDEEDIRNFNQTVAVEENVYFHANVGEELNVRINNDGQVIEVDL